MLETPSSNNDRRYPEDTRIARILDIVWRISTRPRYWSRRALAEQFEVSERTITSDFDIIRHRLNFELELDRGQGYYFKRVPQLPSVSYSAPEALALILAAEAGRHSSGISQQDLASAIARLESVFPGDLGRMVRRRSDGLLADQLTHREKMVQTCADAAVNRHQLQIDYATANRGGDETQRVIDPFAVFPYGRAWHVVGHCHLRNATRVFKVDRIRAATILSDRFVAPKEFDLSQFLADGWGLMRGLSSPVDDVELHFSAIAAPWIVDEQWHPSQVLLQQEDGSLEFRVTIQITPEFQRWVFGHGREVEVHAPESLRRWVIDEATVVLLAATSGCA